MLPSPFSFSCFSVSVRHCYLNGSLFIMYVFDQHGKFSIPLSVTLILVCPTFLGIAFLSPSLSLSSLSLSLCLSLYLSLSLCLSVCLCLFVCHSLSLSVSDHLSVVLSLSFCLFFLFFSTHYCYLNGSHFCCLY